MRNLIKFADIARAGSALVCEDRLFVGLDLQRPAPFDAPESDGTPEAQKQALRERLQILIDCIDLLIAPESRTE
jgi:hypothetical protein